MKVISTIVVIVVLVAGGAPFSSAARIRKGSSGGENKQQEDAAASSSKRWSSSASHADKGRWLADRGKGAMEPPPTPIPPTKPPSPPPSSTPTRTPMPSVSNQPSLEPSISAQPTYAPYWEEITYDDFEGGWGNYTRVDAASATDPGDANLVNNPTSNQQTWVKEGIAAIRLRDQSGIESSFWHKDDHDVTGYNNLKVRFWYASREMALSDGWLSNNDDRFFLEYSSDGGANWRKIKKFTYGTDFQNHDADNNNMMVAIVDFNAEDPSYVRSTSGRIRFRCQALGDNSRVYIDKVKFSGEVVGAS